VEVVCLAVELAAFGVHIGAHAAHQMFAGGEHRVDVAQAPVFDDEDQVRVQLVDGAAAAR
jgi:hypothetical protein